MPNVSHSSLTGAELHEPKGADSASSAQIYIADGLGSGDWRYLPHGFCTYSNIGTGVTYTAPTAYTLINPTTTADPAPRDVTHNSANRLTYAGTVTLDFDLRAAITLKHSSASLVDVFFQFHKNGSPIGTEGVTAALSGNYTHVSLLAHTSLVTGDYIEVYGKTASGNIVVHAVSMMIDGKV